MAKVCKVKKVIRAHQALEGAGVKLKRVVGFDTRYDTDPFLLLDHFGSDDPNDYLLGFPWHPHRGIETVTYMLEGRMEHGDSLDNVSAISPGGVQWMTAGSGIIHQEMPKPINGLMYGFQLWVNLPKERKMTTPVYREVKTSDIPVIESSESKVKIISGKYKKLNGAVKDLFEDIIYFDIRIWPTATFAYEVNEEYRCFIYVYDGVVELPGHQGFVRSEEFVIFDKGDRVEMKAGSDGVRLLLLGGKPLNEHIAWKGPIVMNTAEELDVAFEEFYNGSFIKHKS